VKTEWQNVHQLAAYSLKGNRQIAKTPVAKQDETLRVKLPERLLLGDCFHYLIRVKSFFIYLIVSMN